VGLKKYGVEWSKETEVKDEKMEIGELIDVRMSK